MKNIRNLCMDMWHNGTMTILILFGVFALVFGLGAGIQLWLS